MKAAMRFNNNTKKLKLHPLQTGEKAISIQEQPNHLQNILSWYSELQEKLKKKIIVMLPFCFLRVSKCQWTFSFIRKSSSDNVFPVNEWHQKRLKPVYRDEQIQKMNRWKSAKHISRFRRNQALKRQNEYKRWWHLISKHIEHRKATIIRTECWSAKNEKNKKYNRQWNKNLSIDQRQDVTCSLTLESQAHTLQAGWKVQAGWKSLSVRAIWEATWPQTDRDYSLADVDILGLRNISQSAVGNLLFCFKCMELRINIHTLVTHTFITHPSKSQIGFLTWSANMQPQLISFARNQLEYVNPFNVAWDLSSILPLGFPRCFCSSLWLNRDKGFSPVLQYTKLILMALLSRGHWLSDLNEYLAKLQTR